MRVSEPSPLLGDGYYVARAILDRAQTRPALEHISALLDAGRIGGRNRGDEYEQAFVAAMNVRAKSPIVEGLSHSVVLAKLAADLLGVDSIRILHDNLFIKKPNDAATPIHADQWHWPLLSEKTVTAWIPLNPVRSRSGSIVYYPGSHRLENAERWRLFNISEDALAGELEALGFVRMTTQYECGDVAFHLGWTFHSADSNLTETRRIVLSVSYTEAEARIGNPQGRPAPNSVLDAWCPGCRVGDVISSPLNPILYSRAS